jgi:hypothetical protein
VIHINYGGMEEQEPKALD